MKRKDLYNYVRTEIINELTLSEDTIQYTDSQGKDSIANIDINTPEGKKSIDTLKKDSNTKAVINTKTNQKIKEGDIAEARKGSNIKAGTNFATIKSVYAGSMIERILNKIEEAGDEGVTPKEIMIAVGIKAPSQLNPIMRELMELGAISGPAPKEVEAEPEETTPEDDLTNLGIPKVIDNPEDKEVDDGELEPKDDWEKSEEEDSTEEEPKTADIKAADKEAEKVVGGKSNAKKLSPEDEEKYTKLKAGILAKVSKIKKLPQAKRISSDDFKILKQLIAREDVKKLFKDKGVSLKDVVSDVM
jgi:hypothetical protein